MLAKFRHLDRSQGRVRTVLLLALLYWLDIFLFSLPVASHHIPDLLVPTMLLIGLPILYWMVKYAFENAREEQMELAYKDDLTGLGNRRAFRLMGQQRLGVARAGTVALVLVDVDGLKRMNETCGHQAGDELLTHLSDHLTQVAGDSSTVFRYGGDEFAILVDRRNGRAAAEIVGRLNGFAATFATCQHNHHVAISYGFVSNLDGETMDVLFQRGDQRLRDFKRRRDGSAGQTPAPDCSAIETDSAELEADTPNISMLEDRRRLARRAT